MVIDKTNLAYEAAIYLGNFVLTYLLCMVAGHGPMAFVLDYGCVATALAATGLFHVASYRSPAPLMVHKP